MADNSDYYSLLGISRNATADEIKTAYRKLARELHPDRETGDTRKMQDLNEAYRILGNEDRKKEYDNILSQASVEGKRGTRTESGTSHNRNNSGPNNRARTREYVNDPFADLFTGTGDMSNLFDEYARQIHVDLNNMFNDMSGFGFSPRQQVKDEFVMPENDWALLNALRKAYEAKEDAEWTVSRVDKDRRAYIPRDLYKVRRVDGEVVIFRTVKDFRHEYRREEPIIIQSKDGKKTEYNSTALIGEGLFRDGATQLYNDSVAIPYGLYEYLKALHRLARKFATKEMSSEGKYDVDKELRTINHYSETSAFRYAQEGVRKEGKELIERVPFSQFFSKLENAGTLVREIKGTGKEGQNSNRGENTRK